jgi:hypothetical protein
MKNYCSASVKLLPRRAGLIPGVASGSGADCVPIHGDAQGYISESHFNGSNHIHTPLKSRTDTDAIEQRVVLTLPDLDCLNLLTLLD